jgi:hypothetical protein
VPIRTHTIERPEGDEPITRADVEHHVPRTDARELEDAIPDRQEVLQRSSSLLDIVAVTAMEEPACPPVELFGS